MSGGLMSGGRMSGGRLSGGLKSYDPISRIGRHSAGYNIGMRVVLYKL